MAQAVLEQPTDLTLPVEGVQGRIHEVRGQRVILAADLAALYGVTTSRLNEQVKRNIERFPTDFAFVLTAAEAEGLISQIAMSKVPSSSASGTRPVGGRGGRRHLPWAFTEHGAIMAASVLNSPAAVAASVLVVRAFIRMRQALVVHAELAARLSDLERTVGDHDDANVGLIETLRAMMEPPPERPRERIGFRQTDG